MNSVSKVLGKKKEKLLNQDYRTSKIYFKINVKDRKAIFDKRKLREIVASEPELKSANVSFSSGRK